MRNLRLKSSTRFELKTSLIVSPLLKLHFLIRFLQSKSLCYESNIFVVRVQEACLEWCTCKCKFLLYQSLYILTRAYIGHNKWQQDWDSSDIIGLREKSYADRSCIRIHGRSNWRWSSLNCVLDIMKEDKACETLHVLEATTMKLSSESRSTRGRRMAVAASVRKQWRPALAHAEASSLPINERWKSELSLSWAQIAVKIFPHSQSLAEARRECFSGFFAKNRCCWFFAQLVVELVCPKHTQYRASFSLSPVLHVGISMGLCIDLFWLEKSQQQVLLLFASQPWEGSTSLPCPKSKEEELYLTENSTMTLPARSSFVNLSSSSSVAA